MKTTTHNLSQCIINGNASPCSNSTTAILTNMKLCREMNPFTLTNNAMLNSAGNILIVSLIETVVY